MKLAILLLCSLIVIPSVISRGKQKHKRLRDPSIYTGCKPEDKICETRPKHFCRFSNFRYQCPRKCGMCAPFEPKCPKENKFGCCWTGATATDIDKSSCPVCSDISKTICNRPWIKKDCNFAKSTRTTRFLCPVTCGACGDFGNDNGHNRAPYPDFGCEDVDERCAKMKDTSCCEDNEILQDLCRKTCGLC